MLYRQRMNYWKVVRSRYWPSQNKFYLKILFYSLFLIHFLMFFILHSTLNSHIAGRNLNKSSLVSVSCAVLYFSPNDASFNQLASSFLPFSPADVKCIWIRANAFYQFLFYWPIFIVINVLFYGSAVSRSVTKTALYYILFFNCNENV